MSKKKDAQDKAPKSGKGKAPLTPEEQEEKALQSFMSEIESDIRDEQLQKLWQQYRWVLIGLVFLIVAGVAGYQAWEQYQNEQRAIQAEDFDAGRTAITAQNPEQALTAFAEAASLGGGYGTLARLQSAAILIEQGNLQDALLVYESIANDSSADPVFRDLAAVLRVLHGLDQDDPATLESWLTPLTNPSNPFNYSALELSAVLAEEQGERDRARALVRQLLDDPGTPSGIRGRAEEFAAVLGESPAGSNASP